MTWLIAVAALATVALLVTGIRMGGGSVADVLLVGWLWIKKQAGRLRAKPDDSDEAGA